MSRLRKEVGKKGGFASSEQEAYLNLLRTHDRLSGEFDQLFKSHGISDPQYNVLRILRGHNRPLPVYHIASEMITRQPDITRLVDRLESAGLVRRDRGRDDRRVVEVALTTKGRGLLRKLDRPVARLHADQLGHLSAGQLRTLSRLLCKARESTKPES